MSAGDGPGVSDHALLRFLERSGQLDVEALRAGLSASLARAHSAARQLGQEDYLVKAGGTTFVVRGGVVTTLRDSGDPGREARVLEKREK